MGYLFDVDNGKYAPEKNPAKYVGIWSDAILAATNARVNGMAKSRALKTILKLRLESLICIMILMTLCVILMAIFNIYMISTVGNKYKI